MKELFKPTEIEEQCVIVSTYDEGCTRDCDPGGGSGICDKYCTEGATNNAPIDENDILF